MADTSPKFQDELKRFSEIVELFTERLTRKEFTAAFKAVTDAVEKTRGELSDAAKALADAVETARNQLTEQNTTLSSQTQQSVSAALSEALASVQAKIAEIDAKLATVKDGETPDIDEVARLAAEKIQLPEYRAPLMDGPEEIRNKLEAAYAETENEDERLDPRIIRGYAKLLKEIEELKKRPAGGSTTMNVAHWPRHESFTMNGSDTFVTLTQAVAAQGNAIFGVRYQGQTLAHTDQYTVNGNKITFVGFTPESGTIIDVTYIG